MKIETFLEKNSRKIKKEYTILQVIEVFEEKIRLIMANNRVCLFYN